MMSQRRFWIFHQYPPSLITTPDTPYVGYLGDSQTETTSVFIPLYDRFQFVELKAGCILTIGTTNSDEAIYYANMVIPNTSILCDPDPSSDVPPEPAGDAHFSKLTWTWPIDDDNDQTFLYQEDGVYILGKGMFEGDPDKEFENLYDATCSTPVKRFILPDLSEFSDLEEDEYVCTLMYMTPAEDFEHPVAQEYVYIDGSMENGNGIAYIYIIYISKEDNELVASVRCSETFNDFIPAVVK